MKTAMSTSIIPIIQERGTPVGGKVDIGLHGFHQIFHVGRDQIPNIIIGVSMLKNEKINGIRQVIKTYLTLMFRSINTDTHSEMQYMFSANMNIDAACLTSAHIQQCKLHAELYHHKNLVFSPPKEFLHREKGTQKWHT